MIDVKVDDGVLQGLADNLKNSASEMGRVADAYQQDVGVMRGCWTGDAADSAGRFHQDWSTDLSQQIDYLEQLAKAIEQIDEIYQKAEQEAASFWPF
ncbi:MAG: WXG100 family type VII secretion target [Propionibacteriaceae bacterium]|nr:WXG100 family type VII secretion target [Propionibacteriaceae bacterium]